MDLLTALLFLFGQAQPSVLPDAGQLAKIEGRVVHALTGEPVRKAKLTLRKRSVDMMAPPGAAPAGAASDDEGRFVFDKLEPGTYSLYAERSGFLRQEHGARGNPFMGTPLTLRAGEQMTGVTFKLLPQAVIAGRVVDDEGEPVQHAQVQAMRQAGSGGQAMSMGVATNDLGEFRVADLAPGRYLLRVMPGPNMFGGAPTPPPEKEGQKRRQALLPTYYPGVTDAAGASPINVSPGQQVSGISVQLQKGSVYRISGKLSARPAAGRMARVMIMTRQRGSMSFGGGGSGMVKPDGAFDIDNVQPGSYYLIGTQNDISGGRPQPLGRAAVDVTDQDVEGVTLVPQDSVDINGTVRVEGEKQVSTAGMRLMLVPAEMMPFSASNAAVGEGDAFQLNGVMTDRYYLSFFGIPQDYYVRAARFGNEDALKGLHVTGAGQLEILLAPGAATVQGLVEQENKPYPGAFVLLASEPYAPEKTYLRKFATSDQNGRYEFKSVAPGDYRVYAWPEPQMPMPSQAEDLKPFQNNSAKITVREGGSEQANVTVIAVP
jgi:protocatechuate 3,4-dioxygenase beta subunit